MTAEELLKELRVLGCDPAVEGFELVLAAAPPAGLEPVIDLLQAPVRALLTGRTLYGFDAKGCPAGRNGILNLREPLPADVRLLCVEGGGPMDRISPFAKAALPQLFATSATARASR